MSYYDQDVDPINVTSHDPYVCTIPNDADDSSAYYDPDCPYTCQGLTECEDCSCAVVDDGEGPWGRAMDVIMCLLPILFLIIATVPPCGMKAMSTTKSLPTSALFMYLNRLMYLGSDPLLVCGAVIKGIYTRL